MTNIAEKFQVYYIVAMMEKRVREVLWSTDIDKLIDTGVVINDVMDKLFECMSLDIDIDWRSVIDRLLACGNAVIKRAERLIVV